MSQLRTAASIAKRAIILSVMDFRGRLEATSTHPRAPAISRSLLPWLIRCGLEKQIDPIEREELETPLCGLSVSQMVDIRSAAQLTYYYSWVLGHVDILSYCERDDPNKFSSILQPLTMDTEAFIKQATCRDPHEVEHSCKQFTLMLSYFRESRVDEQTAKTIVRRMQLDQLYKCGLVASSSDIDDALEMINRLSKPQRTDMAGKSFLLSIASQWLFTRRRHFWKG